MLSQHFTAVHSTRISASDLLFFFLDLQYNFFCEELPWLPPSARRRRNVAAYQESMLADLKLTAKKGGVVDLEAR